MSSPETFLAFGAIMLIVALIGVAIDWFGKPLRHRKFIPKAYKFPDERLFRSDVFNSSPSPQVTKPSHQKETRNGENLINTTDDNEPKNEDSVQSRLRLDWARDGRDSYTSNQRRKPESISQEYFEFRRDKNCG